MTTTALSGEKQLRLCRVLEELSSVCRFIIPAARVGVLNGTCITVERPNDAVAEIRRALTAIYHDWSSDARLSEHPFSALVICLYGDGVGLQTIRDSGAQMALRHLAKRAFVFGAFEREYFARVAGGADLDFDLFIMRRSIGARDAKFFRRALTEPKPAPQSPRTESQVLSGIEDGGWRPADRIFLKLQVESPHA